MIEVRGAVMDPVSVTACSQAAAGIPKRGTKGMLPVKNCRGYMSAQQSSGGQAWRTTENLHKSLAFLPLLCYCFMVQWQNTV